MYPTDTDELGYLTNTWNLHQNDWRIHIFDKVLILFLLVERCDLYFRKPICKTMLSDNISCYNNFNILVVTLFSNSMCIKDIVG